MNLLQKKKEHVESTCVVFFPQCDFLACSIPPCYFRQVGNVAEHLMLVLHYHELLVLLVVSVMHVCALEAVETQQFRGGLI